MELKIGESQKAGKETLNLNHENWARRFSRFWSSPASSAAMGSRRCPVAEQLVFAQSCALKVSEDLSPKSGKVVAIKIHHRRRLQRTSIADHARNMT